VRFQQVIGISYPKTGSRSLAQAFFLLGYSAAHGPMTRGEEWDMRRKIALGRTDFLLLERYEFCGQLAPFWRRLMVERPQAGFILLEREIEGWLLSVERHWRRVISHRRIEWAQRGLYDVGSLFRLLLFGCVNYQEKEFAKRYRRHSKAVRAAFRDDPDRLLVYDLCGGAGWGPLCQWLGVKTPENFGFPRIRMGGAGHAQGFTIEAAEAQADASPEAPGQVEQ
jgi:hypothetical protein